MMKVTNNQAGPRGLNTKDSSQSDEFQGRGSDSDRDDLKKQADELGIEYAKNIPTDKLKELVDAKLAE
jgi:hypothetical protein